MTDEELLELAAKAAGLKVQYSDNFGDYSIGEPYSRGEVRWNPLDNDSDAFRLADELSLCVDFGACIIKWDHGCSALEYENYKSDVAKVRRAIVRAAAEIGRNMPA